MDLRIHATKHVLICETFNIEVRKHEFIADTLENNYMQVYAKMHVQNCVFIIISSGHPTLGCSKLSVQ